MADANILVENSDLPGVRQAGQFNTKLPMSLQGSAANLSVGGNLTVTGTLSAGSEATTSQVITASSANAFTVGAAGTTNPAFNVDTGGGVTDVTGLNVNSASAGSGLALTVISSGTNEDLQIDSKGPTSSINIGKNDGRIIQLGSTSNIGINGTSRNANGFTIGPNSTTNPTLKVDTSVSSEATGVLIKGAAAGSGIALSAISSGTNEDIYFDPQGSSAAIHLGGIAGNVITLGRAGFAGVNATSNNANAFTIGPNSTTNPTLQVDASTSSAATGLNIKSAAAGAGVAFSVISSGAAENLTVAAKGTTGTITFNPAITATAGGAVADGIQYGSLNVGLYTGTGAPTFSAMNGSIYTDSSATSTTTRLYVNKSGAATAGTTWTNLTTAA